MRPIWHMRHMGHAQIIQLTEILAKATRRSPRTISRITAGSGDVYDRLVGAKGITVRRALKIVQAISNLWPADLVWPSDIPRPVPEVGTPGAEGLNNSGSADSLPPEYALNTKGHIADVAAFCAAIHVTRDNFYKAVHTYGTGGTKAGRKPREHTEARNIVAALAAARDTRFKRQTETMIDLPARIKGSNPQLLSTEMKGFSQ